MVSRRASSLATKLDVARKDLLDLGLRNPLISYRSLKTKGLDVIDELPPQVFSLLVTEGKPAYFLPVPETLAQQALDDDAADSEIALTQPEDERPASRHTDDKLQTSLTSTRLQTRLLSTYYVARASIEEQGVNILYLALGMLEWYESEDSQDARRAPLILVPVTLERSAARERFQLRYSDEDLEENISLREKLKEFRLELPPFPDADDLDVAQYFAAVSKAIRPEKRWKVNEGAIALGFFSFSKLLMYRDLDPEKWPPEHSLENHPIIGALLQDGFGEPEFSPSDEDHLDEFGASDQVVSVVDADSSQLLVLLKAQAGRNLVVQGPPGTGKSQTITNLIANAITAGKTVLFVSEKMAALEVVKRRLDRIGIGDACLELHSHKANKRALLDELKRTLDLGRPRVGDHKPDLAELLATRGRLNEYCTALNTPVGTAGVTPYEALGRLVRLQQRYPGKELAGISIEGMADWSADTVRLRLATVEELQEQLRLTGIPVQHPFWGSRLTTCLPQDEWKIEEILNEASTALDDLRRTDADLAALYLSASSCPTGTKNLLSTCERVLAAPDLSGISVDSPDWRLKQAAIRDGIEAGAELQDLHSRFDGQLTATAWDFNTTDAYQALVALGPKWWHRLSGQYRGALRLARAQFAGESPKEFEAIKAALEAIARAQAEAARLDGAAPLLEKLFGNRWNGPRSSWVEMRRCADYLAQIHSEISEEKLPPEILRVLDDVVAGRDLKAQTRTVHSALATWHQRFEAIIEVLGLDVQAALGKAPSDVDYAAAAARIADWLAHLPQLHDLATLNRILALCDEQSLGTLRSPTSDWLEAADRLVDSFRKAWFRAIYERASRERPSLAHFDADSQTRQVEKYRKLDRLVIDNTRAQIAMTHWSNLPRMYGAGQLGTLQREFEKRRRHLPIRKLIAQAGRAVIAIKPVLMMSPLSIAAFLEPGSLTFDVVVFDEASQVRPVDALGAIARGGQAIVVGDDRQLPPTSFFDSVTEVAPEDEEDSVDRPSDLESILGLFRSQGLKPSMLKWHYRSKHPSLIAVSNKEFYDNKLVLFPSPDGTIRELGLVFHPVLDGVYDRGRSRKNEREAAVVADAVMEHARAQLHRPPEEQRTLGVAAFSASQMEAIRGRLEYLRRLDDSCEEFFPMRPDEPFFVKNLENVQGDERDVIFISVGYGRDVNGHITQNFGPLNFDGGERRLNVLISRARERCEVFTNITADDIRTDGNQKHGIQALKTFLEFAETGRLDIPTPVLRDDDSPFEDAVYAALTSRGYALDRQVGTAGFFLDMAVQDSEKPGRYLLAIECDGASYHSARSARDRDRLRQQVLEGLGWRIARVWSTSWFRNEEREIKRLVEAIEKARTELAVNDRLKASATTPEAPIEREGSETTREQSVLREIRADVLVHGYGHGSEAGTAFEAGYRRAIAGQPLNPAAFPEPRLLRAYQKGYSCGGDLLEQGAPAILDREKAARSENGPSLPSYVVSTPGVHLGTSQLHEIAPSRMAEWVQAVVDVEGPVHIDEICRRIADAAGVQRVGSRIRPAIERGCSTIVLRTPISRSGSFYWRDAARRVSPRDRSSLPIGSRKLELVAPEEIEEVVSLVVAESCGIEPEELPSAVCRLLGFGRCSADMRAQIDAVVASATKKKRLQKRNGQIFVQD